MVSPEDEGNAYPGAVKHDGVEFCVDFMWQISLCMCYTVHSG